MEVKTVEDISCDENLQISFNGDFELMFVPEEKKDVYALSTAIGKIIADLRRNKEDNYAVEFTENGHGFIMNVSHLDLEQEFGVDLGFTADGLMTWLFLTIKELMEFKKILRNY